MIQLIDHSYDLTPLQDGYADFVKRWTAEEEAEFNDHRFHASGLGLCQRHQILKREGFEGRPPSEEKLIDWAEANFIHAGMTNFWMKNGTAIAREQRFDDVPVEIRTDHLMTRLMSPFPGWTGKFDALIHRREWCGPKCDRTSKELAAIWDTMVRLFNQKDDDWLIYRDIIKAHLIMPCSLKTVNAFGLKHYLEGPKLHNVWQDSVYVASANGAYGLEWDKILIMYRGRGGGGRPIFHLVKALDPAKLIAECDAAWDAYQEDQRLPEVLDLVAEFEADKTYGEGVRLATSWECGYCEYAGWTHQHGGFNCEPKATKNKGSDRVAVMQEDETAVVVEEWCRKAGYDIRYVSDKIMALFGAQGRDGRVITVKTDKSLKK